MKKNKKLYINLGLLSFFIWLLIFSYNSSKRKPENVGELLKDFSWLHQWKDPKDNLYWTGYVYPDKAFWPIEKPTGTAAAVLLAADTLFKFTEASELFLKDWSK